MPTKELVIHLCQRFEFKLWERQAASGILEQSTKDSIADDLRRAATILQARAVILELGGDYDTGDSNAR